MKKYALLFLMIGTIIMIVVMAKTGATLKTPTTPKGILDLEFAYNTTKTTIVTASWAPNNIIDNISKAKINTYYDFIFLLFYSFLLFFTCKKIAKKHTGSTGNAGLLIAKGVLLAGMLDILENMGMLITLSGHSSSAIAMFTTICSVIKWGLVIIAVGYCLAGLIYLIWQRKISFLFN